MLSLEGAVIHARTTPETQKHLSEKFAELLPRRIIFDRESDVFAFQVTSEWAEIVAAYIIGIAAAISGDTEFAEELFRQVESRFCNERDFPPPLRKIQTRLPARFLDLADYRVTKAYNAWWMTRDRQYLLDAETHLDRLQELAPNHYGGHLTRAICHMVLRRDLAAAKREIRQCRSEENATWRYSDAFLTAYEGNLRKARRLYRAAFRKESDPSVPVQAEEFICEVLAQEPDKYHLWFCTGLINFFAKQDYQAALRDMERFLQSGSVDEFEEERRLARELIREAEGQMS